MLTATRLREVLSYNQDTGEFRWLVSRFGATAGVLAGNSSHRKGYIQIRVDYRRYYAHRLAWLYVHGEWPQVIDHINGDTSDNRICNLRSTSQQRNLQNMRPKANKYGLTGVCLHQKTGLFQAAIKINKQRKSLGYFKTPQEAHDAYMAAKAGRDAPA